MVDKTLRLHAMEVPFLDLHAHHARLMDELKAAICSVIEAGAFAGGPFVVAFEKDFAEFCQTHHAVGVGSGTEAIWLALLACGIGPGDEVITSPCTFIATAEAISYCGAVPVFVDIDPFTYTLDPARLEDAITERTRAIIPVHLFGHPADMDPIKAIAQKHGLFVLEDACQAHGATYKGRPAGSLGNAGCFSFYPSKNLGAFGEAGGLSTDDGDLAQKVKILREHGQSRKNFHERIGWNCRMDGIQGAVLQIKLRHLQSANQLRHERAAMYRTLLQDVEEVMLPTEPLHGTHAYHIFALRVRCRDEVMEKMTASGIGCGIHYPVPLHLQAAYRHLGHTVGDFPVAERAASEFLSIPMYPELTADQIETVARAVKDAVFR